MMPSAQPMKIKSSPTVRQLALDVCERKEQKHQFGHQFVKMFKLILLIITEGNGMAIIKWYQTIVNGVPSEDTENFTV